MLSKKNSNGNVGSCSSVPSHSLDRLAYSSMDGSWFRNLCVGPDKLEYMILSLPEGIEIFIIDGILFEKMS
jgi:hypothetical protein